MARMRIIFNGFEKLAAELNAMGVDLHPAVDEALTETQKYVQENLEIAAEPYKNGGIKGWAKGNLNDAIIRNPVIDWENYYSASVKVGFSSENFRGFMHSIFVMYGVPAHGKFNKGYQKDAKIYNAIRGTKTRNQIKKKQEEVMKKYLKLGR